MFDSLSSLSRRDRGSSRHARVAALWIGALLAGSVAAQRNVTDLGHGKPGSRGVPRFSVTAPRLGEPLRIAVDNARPGANAYVILGLRRQDLRIFGGRLVPSPDAALAVRTDRAGHAEVSLPIPTSKRLGGRQLYVQWLIADPGATFGLAFSNALLAELFPVVESDFDGDGRSDLATGVPGEDIGAVGDAGAVSVIYGGGGGFLTSTGNQLWHQDAPGIGDAVEAGDRFGAAVAHGDFNGDGYSDLAVGVPGEDVGAVLTAGSVHVLFGSPAGLTATGSQIWHQNTAGVLGVAEAGDELGAALVAGDFDSDGYADLAIGVPGEGIGAAGNAGAVHLLRGGPGGLTATGDQLWHQNSPGIDDVAEAGDRFGASLAAGDFDGDGRDDLAVGVPRENVGAWSDAGAVNVLRGSTAGLTGVADQLWHQAIAGLVDLAEAGDRFGSALAAGDFDGDGRDDLAIGIPGEDVGAVSDAGAVHVLPGGVAGLTATGDAIWHQNSAGVIDYCEAGDRLGSALAAADFNGDGRDDLAIGVPGEDVGTVSFAGAVNVLRGGLGGLSATGDQLWHQNSAGIADVCEPGDRFGWTLGFGDYDGDGRADLAIGVPMESVGTAAAAGAVQVLGGSPFLLTAGGDEQWHQNSPGIGGFCEPGDRFGAALSP